MNIVSLAPAPLHRVGKASKKVIPHDAIGRSRGEAFILAST